MIHIIKRCLPIKGCVYLVPLGDLHIGSYEFSQRAQEKFQGYVEWILEHENAWTFLMGDIMNCSTNDSAGRPAEELMGATEQFELALNLFRPLAKGGRIIGGIMGNHEWQLVRATGSGLKRTRELCAALEIPYCGADAFLTLDVSEDENPHHRRLYDVYITHGYGGGRKRGSKINNLEELEHNAEAEIYICGHVHDSLPFRKEVPYRDNKNKLALKKKGFTTAGSFLETIILNEVDEGYAARKAYSPICIGAPRIRLEASHNRGKDIHISI